MSRINYAEMSFRHTSCWDAYGGGWACPAPFCALASDHEPVHWGPSLDLSCAERGEEWREGSGEAVSGVLYKAADGAERIARADLSIICDGMYSSLRSKLSTPRIRCRGSLLTLLGRPA